jgi:hypothetical protein
MPNAQTPDGVLSGSGWMQTPGKWLLVLSGPGTLTSRSRYVLCAAATPFSLTLPAASSVAVGANITLKKIDYGSSSVLINARTNNVINGTSPYILSNPMQYVTFVSDGTSTWNAVNEGGTYALEMTGCPGIFNTSPPTTQPALCVTLADTIAVLTGVGLCAAS